MAAGIAAFGLASAQSTGFEGTSFISGQVEYNRTNNNGSNTTVDNFAILPSVGTFVTPTIAVGGALGYQSSIVENTTAITTKNTNSAFVIMPFARKYWSLGEKLFVFGQLDVPMAFGKVKNEVAGVSTEANYTSFGVNLRPGLDYFVNNNWSFEATIGQFGYNSFKPEGGSSTDNFGIGLNLNSITFGVKYLFK